MITTKQTINAEEIQNELQTICKAFYLGKLRSWRSETPGAPVAGYVLTYFNTTKEANLKHWLKLKK